MTIPNSVTYIGNYAFEGCSGLTAVTIPNSVTYIGNYAFSGCSGLTAINVDSGNRQYMSVDGVLFDYNQTRLICYPGGKTGAYAIPDSVTSIGESAFEGCSGLTDVYYGGTEAQWNAIFIDGGNDSLTDARIHYNSAGPDEPAPTGTPTPTATPTPEPTPTPAATFGLPSALTASDGQPITAASLAQPMEISVPVQYSGTEEQNATVAVAFYDGGGRFVGIGTASVTMHSGENAVLVPVGGVSGAVSMKAFVLDTGLAPLCGAGRYDIPAA